ncbi:hypothetical protein TNIN_43241, partial [Trichonephila inaurata madagascariensis]
MQWLSAVLLGVVIGIVSCDLTCFDTEADRCQKEFSKEVTPSMDDYCREHADCINKATTSEDTECFSETGEEPKDMRKDKEAC